MLQARLTSNTVGGSLLMWIARDRLVYPQPTKKKRRHTRKLKMFSDSSEITDSVLLSSATHLLAFICFILSTWITTKRVRIALKRFWKSLRTTLQTKA